MRHDRADAPSLLRRHAARLVGLALIACLYSLARTPATTESQRGRLAERFRFERQALPDPPGDSSRTVRPVHPSLEHISAWISSVGAGVALADLDGNGLPDDVAWVDTRADRVVIAPVPGTAARYRAFTLPNPAGTYEPATIAPMGCLPTDLNEDGRMDLLVYYWGRPPVVFLRIEHPDSPARELSEAEFRSAELTDEHVRWFTNAATSADIDGDGHIDLVFGQYFPDDARILDPRAGGSSPMQDSMSRAFNGGHSRLFLWKGARAGSDPAVHFAEAKGAFDGLPAPCWTLAVGAADLDGDLLPELYFANDFGPDRLLHNRSRPGAPRFALLEGQRTLTTPSSKVLGRDSFKGMGVDFGDLNGDGRLDLYVSNIAAEFALLESHFAFVSEGSPGLMARGIAPYVDRSESLGLSRSSWSWEARLADFDNDGVVEALQATGFVRGRGDRWPELQELAMGNDELLRDPRSWPRFRPGDDLCGHTQNPFFVRGADGRYCDVAGALGLAEPGASRGIATADVDGDGRLDYAVANQWAPSTFYRNRAPRPGAYLGLHLLLPVGAHDGKLATVTRPGHPARDLLGRPAIGAAATLTLPDGRRLVGQVDGGNGHSGKRSPDLLFGLRSSKPGDPLSVELRWRSAGGAVRRQELRLSPGWHTVRLGEPPSEEVAAR